MLDMFEGDGASRAPGDLNFGKRFLPDNKAEADVLATPFGSTNRPGGIHLFAHASICLPKGKRGTNPPTLPPDVFGCGSPTCQPLYLPFAETYVFCSLVGVKGNLSLLEIYLFPFGLPNESTWACLREPRKQPQGVYPKPGNPEKKPGRSETGARF